MLSTIDSPSPRLTSRVPVVNDARSRDDDGVDAIALSLVDDAQGRFGPMTDRRAAFDLRTGAVTSRARIERALGMPAVTVHVPKMLAGVQAAREPHVRVNAALTGEGDAADVLVVNGRWTGVTDVARVRGLRLGQALVQADGQLVAARLDATRADQLIADRLVPDPRLDIATLDRDILLARPWHILDQLEATLACDLAAITPAVDPTARVHPSAVLDDSGGPVVIAADAVVGPLCVLEGPCYVGPHSTIAPRSLIRRHAVIGPTCKVAGEISFSIIHGHTNKAHEGFLGHSLVGEWVNLGAATNVSNLKNTYGDVQVQLQRHAQPENTGRTFCGPVIGDFTRTAIGTRLLTGSVVGTGAMIALSDFAPKCVERFAFLTDKGSMPTDLDKLLDTARAMMTRRDQQLAPAEENLLRTLAE